jgi:hypothetical protein
MGYIGNAPYQGVVDSGNILDGTIDTIDIKDGAVTNAKLLNSSITINGSPISLGGSVTVGGAVSSVNTLTGNVVLSTTNISEGTSLYYTDARARNAISFTAGSGAYNNSTGVVTIPTNTNQLTNGAGFLTNSIQAIFETATVTAGAPAATTTFDASTQAVQYYTSNATTNFTLNIRGNSSTTLNSVMATGQSLTLALLVTNGGTAYYPTAYQIDGVSITPKWQGGTAPTAGNTSSIDIYAITIIKTASATYTVFASQTKYA